ncbi:unnamed protein product [Dicrocoelium dendriticum]|nr:unnamed protein product [Dicrocoelium dendriticum]
MRLKLTWLYSRISALGIISCTLFIVLAIHLSFEPRENTPLVGHTARDREATHFDNYILSDVPDNIFWFMQITDLHLSERQDLSRVRDFISFFTETVTVIQPELVAISGDLTDARSNVHIRSRQSLSEWKSYHSAILSSGVLNITRIFDIRGNHDMFGVLHVNHTSDYFSRFGVRGREHAGSHFFKIIKPFGTYSFILLDACPTVGVHFPLNFFGQLKPAEETHVIKLALHTEGSNHTFWIGHYPTSTIRSSQLDVRALLGRSAYAYLCGHLHTIGRLITKMYTLQPQGFLELELGDWRDGRYYRVVVVDNDLVSFVDVQLSSRATSFAPEWPVFVVTNPKNSNFLLPHKEPVSRITHSTHIRIVAWSNSQITHVSIKIDNRFIGNATHSVANTLNGRRNVLFTLPWNVSEWMDSSSHTIQVSVSDASGNTKTSSHPFVINGDPTWDFSYAANFVLHADHTYNLRVLFYLLVVGLICIFSIPRCIPRRLLARATYAPRFVRGLLRFSQCGSLSTLVLLYFAYTVTGPIFAGYLVDSTLGVVFSFGIFVAGSFLQESLTYLYEIVQGCEQPATTQRFLTPGKLAIHGYLF